MHDPAIEDAYLLDVLKRLLDTPSPTGMTDAAIAVVCGELEVLDIPFELTRRGAIRATLAGNARQPRRVHPWTTRRFADAFETSHDR